MGLLFFAAVALVANKKLASRHIASPVSTVCTINASVQPPA